MEPSILILMILLTIVMIAAVLISYRIVHRRHLQNLDEDADGTAKRYPVMANPVFWSYVLFGLIGILALAYYFGVYDHTS